MKYPVPFDLLLGEHPFEVGQAAAALRLSESKWRDEPLRSDRLEWSYRACVKCNPGVGMTRQQAVTCWISVAPRKSNNAYGSDPLENEDIPDLVFDFLWPDGSWRWE